MPINYKKGDLIKAGLNAEVDVLVHGCNCFCTMGSGIAKQIKEKFPEAYQSDLCTVKGDRRKLGTIKTADIVILLPNNSKHELVVVNAYTQYTYWNAADMLNYFAVESCFKHIAKLFPDKRIGMPKIGCGLAQGDWDTVSNLLEGAMGELNVTIYTLEAQKYESK